ncbi:MAG: LPS export ABC transporter periplasmic protein LptC [Panacagrimonas sp.]
MNRWFGPLFVIVLAGLAIMVMRGGQPAPSGATVQADQPRYTLRGAQWQRFDAQGQIEFEGRAQSIDYFDDESARLSQFELTALATGGAPWTATAPEGFAPAGTRRVQLRGGVEGQGHWPDNEPLNFQTPEIWLDSAAQQLETEAKVQIQSRTRQVDARGMKVNGKSRKIDLLHDVKMRYVPG